MCARSRSLFRLAQLGLDVQTLALKLRDTLLRIGRALGLPDTLARLRVALAQVIEFRVEARESFAGRQRTRAQLTQVFALALRLFLLPDLRFDLRQRLTRPRRR